MSKVIYKSYSQPLSYLFSRFSEGSLRLQPVFQRSSVWTDRQRVALLESVLRGYPIPALFLYKNTDQTGSTRYEVMDGKQRIETLLMYTGLMKGKLSAPVRLTEDQSPELMDWKKLHRYKLQSRIEDYQVQIIEVEADLPDIIDLFVRINSTGNALTRQEIRNARFYQSEFLKSAKKLASRYEEYLKQAGVLSTQQIRRMKHIELMSELMYAAHIEGVGNKKRVVDAAMSHDGLKGAALVRAEKATVTGLNRLKKMFPGLNYSSRFHKISDFYSLAVLIQTFENRGLILDDRKRNSLAWEMLAALSAGVDSLSLSTKKWNSGPYHHKRSSSDNTFLQLGTGQIPNRIDQNDISFFVRSLSRYSRKKMKGDDSQPSSVEFFGIPLTSGFAAIQSAQILVN